MIEDPSLWQAALQLGIGGLSVAGVIYISVINQKSTKELHAAFLKAMDERADKHEAALQEREKALREVEFSVRTQLTGIITQATMAISDAAKVMGRVVRHLDGEK